jgi:drug/metabolite transporter superfamily protein YnfA
LILFYFNFFTWVLFLGEKRSSGRVFLGNHIIVLRSLIWNLQIDNLLWQIVYELTSYMGYKVWLPGPTGP